MIRRMALGIVLLWSMAGSSVALAAAAGHGEGKDFGPLSFRGVNFRGDLAIWTAAVFLVLLAILWKFAWKPIADALEKREKHIADQIAEAQQANEEGRQRLAEYERRLVAAGDEVRAILEQARRDAAQLGREMLDRAKQDAAAERDRALQQIDDAAAGAMKELADQSATLAVELAGKIVRTRLDPRDHARLIQEAVAAFAGNGSKQ